MQFSGEEGFEQGQQALWDCLSDMQFMARVIPDLDRVDSMDATSLKCRVKPAFSFLTGTLKLSFDVVEKDEPERLKVRTIGKAIGGSVTVDAEIKLAGAEDGAVLGWRAELVERKGLLKPVGASLIQAAAQRVVADFWRRFREKIAENNST